MSDHLLDSAQSVKELAGRLSQISYIDGEETPYDEPPAWTLADGLRDIELECRRLLDEHYPRLVRAESANELNDALGKVRLSLQHIVYHLATTPALRDLIDNAPPLREP